MEEVEEQVVVNIHPGLRNLIATIIKKEVAVVANTQWAPFNLIKIHMLKNFNNHKFMTQIVHIHLSTINKDDLIF
jgi:hypothetical protein